MTHPKHPTPFLEVRYEVVELTPPVVAFCAGYESGEWRADQLARHLLHWLPEFALSFSEWADLGAHNAVEMIGIAARSIYTSEKYQRRGEFGEVLLHAMLRQHFGSIPAISKYYFKDASNDTVKGFDAVHVVRSDSEWELWLGEVKFYNDFSAAARDVCKELEEHSKRDYLRSEFSAITRKVDKQWPEAADLLALLHQNTSLDKIFARVTIPVLLTYDSTVVQSHSAVTAEYIAALKAEVDTHRTSFSERIPELPVAVRLLLLPLANKARLVALMDEALKKCQAAF